MEPCEGLASALLHLFHDIDGILSKLIVVALERMTKLSWRGAQEMPAGNHGTAF